MSRVCLVHGFNVRDGGTRSIDKIAPHLCKLGHVSDCDSADYGWHDLIKVRWFHKKAVERIAEALRKCDAVVTHSNDANYTMKAVEMIDNPITVIHLSPALNRSVKLVPIIKAMHVFHTQNDSTVKWSRLLVGHPWGDAGARGVYQTDPRIVNHDYSYRVCDHSGWFRGLNAKFFARKISELI